MKKNLLLLIFTLFVIGADNYQKQDKKQLEQQLDETFHQLGGPMMETPGDTDSARADWGPEVQKMKEQAAEDSQGFLGQALSNMQEVLVKQILHSNPFADMPKEKVKTLFMQHIQNDQFQKIVNQYPVLLDIIVDLVQDEKALLSLVKISFKKKELKLYGMIFIATFLLNMLYNLLADKKSTLLKKIARRLISNACVFAFNMGAFYVIFREELSPSVNIIRSYIW